MAISNRSKTEIKITCNCGCGFTSDSIVDANEHVEATGHCISIQGEIRKKLLQEQGIPTYGRCPGGSSEKAKRCGCALMGTLTMTTLYASSNRLGRFLFAGKQASDSGNLPFLNLGDSQESLGGDKWQASEQVISPNK